MTNTIQVRAVEGRMIPFVNAAGETFQGAFVGYKVRKPAPGMKLDTLPVWDVVADGVPVPDIAYYRRALDRGDLVLADPPKQSPEQRAQAAGEVSK